ncbi:glycosyltransferase family 4 protein [Vagococcus jeotgali]|uniref:glycosyltransferase family 4 protein n=1 Tax=Vagococcus jeotgali TaxID=3109030 RepID=UPI002DD9D521|nr:glycosyltransferase family 4 protein [Vagococcus sp. B2T-5]
MENKRVLFLVNHDLVIYNFRKEIVQELLDQGYEVYVSSPYGEKIEILISWGCKYIPTDVNRHGKNPIDELKLLKKYKQIIKDINPLCVLTYTIKPNIFGAIACRKYNVPCLANITGLGTAVEKKSILQFITISLYKYAFKEINTIFFQNEENLEFFLEKKISSKNKYVLLPGSGVNLEEFVYVDYPNQDDKIKFIFISRIMKEKGIDLYLEMATIMMKKYDNLEFHICGFCEEDYEDTLKEYEEKNIIIYHGMIKDIKPLLGQMSCTVHPTYYPEGLSNVLLESSAIGRPIITTNRSGCREVVDREENGYLIEENNQGDLVEAVDKFINTSRLTKEIMGKKGREYVVSNFDRKYVVESYLKKIAIIAGEENGL